MVLGDPSSERAVLSGIINYGEVAFLDVSDIIQESSFTVDSNQLIYRCLKHIFEHQNKPNIDLASVYSAAQELELSHVLTKKEEVQHLKAIIDFPANVENIRKFAAKIRKLEIARLLHKKLKEAQDKLLDISGGESVSSIISIAEDTVFNFVSSLNNGDNNPTLLGEGLEEFLQFLEDNPVDQTGISSGMPRYDKAIGGGFRKGTVNIVGARPKAGKTTLSVNMGMHIARQNIPVLNMDTEMSKRDHQFKALGILTDVDITSIETGKYAESPINKTKIKNAAKSLSSLKFHHRVIAGIPFEEQLAIMRRWLVKEVGLKEDGTANDCVIFYDYLKLMDSAGMSQDMKEYQVLGFMMTALHNFAVKYQVPVVAFIQLNRDGITKESTDSASGSDRIIWLCSNFSIFKRKSDEEIAEDGPDAGNRKLIPVISRHGGGLDDNDYINCHMKGWCGQIVEGKTKLELGKGSKTRNEGFIVNDNDNENEENIPFE